MQPAYFISAVGTPLDKSEALDSLALGQHLLDQHQNGIQGVLVAGSMGCMQLLSDQTYRDLAHQASAVCQGKLELLIGAGDCSFARTRGRIEFLNTLRVDGVVVLTPYFFQFAQDELLDYFRSLADVSKAPLYLYDLPQVTHSKIELRTAIELAKHPNIAGIKCSDEPGYARQLMDAVGPRFRVIIAQPILIDIFLRAGVSEHVDGMYAIAPHWASAIGRAVAAGEWDTAALFQRRLYELRKLFETYDAYQAMSVMLNRRGIAGYYAPRPYRVMDEQTKAKLLAEPVVRELLDKA
jgi:4-hydroxy-tetrahydrodipicolinate synthase